MIEKDLDTRFEEAVEQALKISQTSLPQDVQLRLYALYKHASIEPVSYRSEHHDLRNAFKTNAWIQIRHLSLEEAKENYIEIINSIIAKQ